LYWTVQILFVHGTGVRDVSRSMELIRDGAKRILKMDPGDVIAVEWGKKVGPQDLDITPSLPPEDTTRGLGEDDEDVAALWQVLLADPAAELRVLAEQPPQEVGMFDPAADPVDVAVRNRVAGAQPPEEALTHAGFSAADLAGVRDALADDPLLADAAAAAGDPADRDLVEAIARALVAAMLAAHAADEPLPAAAVDATARDQLVDALTQAIAPDGTRGVFKGLAGKVLGPLATRVAVNHRAQFMGPMSDFIRDVAFYVDKGAPVRAYIADAIRQHQQSKPLILLGHSLGGIACVDLLSDPKVMGGADPARIDLLVTVGSQSPLLYLMDALPSLSPRSPDTPVPFVPWLNIYNRDDLLSFCAARVWVNTPVKDEPISAGVPFPASHSAYWSQDRVYELIGKHVPK
jgi:hypothetical protein